MAAAVSAGGCGHAVQSHTDKVCLATVTRDEAAAAAEDLLARMHFEIDKFDADRGIITTRPLPGAQLFEFWRRDTRGAYNIAEANLHSVRRSVEMTFGEGEAGICTECRVHLERLRLSERPVSSSAKAFQLFSESGNTLQRLRIAPEPDYSEQPREVRWLDAGRDHVLESFILETLRNRTNGGDAS
jgi:hypothetical protein